MSGSTPTAVRAARRGRGAWVEDADLKRGGDIQNHFIILAFGSLGVVYGDIGTSPLYAFASIFSKQPTSKQDILGAASLTFWMLTIILVLKYVVIVLRADDHGEGGTFALYSLLCRSIGINPLGHQAPAADQDLTTYSYEPQGHSSAGPPIASAPASSTGVAGKLKGAFQHRAWLQQALMVAAVAATSMVLGDGVFTPAISVLSAVSGLTTLLPSISQDTIIAITVALLVVLFAVQQWGTHRVSLSFAPIITIWFLSLTMISLFRFAKHGVEALAAINPAYIVWFFQNRGPHSWKVLGDVVLVVTGAEALYADMGHFSRRSMMLSAATVAYPALAITYLSQAAYLIDEPQAYATLFWSWVPGSVQWPMLILATAATIIASQALISVSFSIVSQAMKLGMFPTMSVQHTGAGHAGQIYISEVNYLLMIACVLVVGGFRDTVALGHAYGLTVVTVMTITTVLLALVMLLVWGWRLLPVLAVCGPLLALELAILAASLPKVAEGAWVALLVAFMVSAVMLAWWYVQSLKRRCKHTTGSATTRPLQGLLALAQAPMGPDSAAAAGCSSGVASGSSCSDHQQQQQHMTEVVHTPTGRVLARTMGVGVYYMPSVTEAPQLLDHLLTLIPALPRVVVLLSVHYAPVSNVTAEERFLVQSLEGIPHVYQVVARYGYMDQPCHDEEFVRRLTGCITASVLTQWCADKQQKQQDEEGEEEEAAFGTTSNPAPRRSLPNSVPGAVDSNLDDTTAAQQGLQQAVQSQQVAPFDIEQGVQTAEQQQGAASAEASSLQASSGSSVKARSLRASSGSSANRVMLRSGACADAMVLESACRQGVVQVVAHEVVQSAPGSSMAKQVLVGGVYPVLALGARRAAQAMQLPPSSTLEVLLAVQV